MREQSLIQPLIEHFEGLGYITCTEFRTPGAVPDVLAVQPDRRKVHQRLAKGQILPLTRGLYWEVLSLIPDKNSDSAPDWQEVAQQLGLSPSYFRRQILARLVRNSYVQLEGNSCVKINGFHPYCRALVSVEAKVKDWRHAGEQALRHQRFVNQAFVALPSQHLRPALSQLDAFRQANLGLLEIDNSGKVVIHHSPKCRPAATMSLYYTALDSLWIRVQQRIMRGEPSPIRRVR